MSEWIKVSERLPESPHCVCIVTYQLNGAARAIMACMDFDKSWYCPISYNTVYNVTHWMPLPDAPEEE